MNDIDSGVAGWNDFSDVSNAARRALRDGAGVSIPNRQFVARVQAVNRQGDVDEQLRLLTKPIYRYGGKAGEVEDGAIFSYVRGTDPELLLYGRYCRSRRLHVEDFRFPDLEGALRAVKRTGVPLVIGSAGFGGASVHVDFCLERLARVAKFVVVFLMSDLHWRDLLTSDW